MGYNVPRAIIIEKVKRDRKEVALFVMMGPFWVWKKCGPLSKENVFV